MWTPDHLRPFGLKSKALLERKGCRVEDNLLRSRAQTDAFQAERDVETAPQTFIGGKRVGGSSNVPLGPVSLAENLMMVAMGVWMLAK